MSVPSKAAALVWVEVEDGAVALFGDRRGETAEVDAPEPIVL